MTPLWCAAVAGRLSVVKVLLKFGADVDAGKEGVLIVTSHFGVNEFKMRNLFT